MREAQEAASLPSAVPACSAVEVQLARVPHEAAAKLVAHVQACSQVLPPSYSRSLVLRRSKLHGSRFMGACLILC